MQADASGDGLDLLRLRVDEDADPLLLEALAKQGSGLGIEAGEWLGQLTLAVRAEVPVDVLLDTIQPYPTFSEAIFSALRELEPKLDS